MEDCDDMNHTAHVRNMVLNRLGSVNVSYLLRMLAIAKDRAERHKGTSFHEFPQTCGGCHFWAGYIGALEDMINGQEAATKLRTINQRQDHDSST